MKIKREYKIMALIAAIGIIILIAFGCSIDHTFEEETQFKKQTLELKLELKKDNPVQLNEDELSRVGKEFTGCSDDRFEVYKNTSGQWIFKDHYTGQENAITESAAVNLCKQITGIH